MNSNRCVSCGFLNFAGASSCKRCKAEFETASPTVGTMAPLHYESPRESGYQSAAQWGQPAYQSAYQRPLYFPGPIAALPRASKHGATNAVLWGLLALTILIAVGIAFVWKFGNSSPANYVWQEYSGRDNSYSVLMPGTAMESVESRPSPVGQLDLKLAMVDKGGNGAYMVGYADYPDNFRSFESDELLETASNGALSRSRSTLVNKKKITLDGYPGVEIEMLPPEGQVSGGGRAFSRIYWVAPRLYITFAGGPDSADINRSVKKFLDSFKLKRRGA